MSISKRLSAIAPSATLAITEKAKALAAAGRPVIGFGVGEPDFPTPAHIVSAAQEAAADPINHHYSPAAGLPELRVAVARKTAAATGWDVAPGNVVISNGAKQAVYVACAALLDPGDEALVLTPYWVSYAEMVTLAGGRVVEVYSGPEQRFKVDVEQLEQARTERTKLMIFNSPSNPSGAVYTAKEVSAIGEWAAEHGIWVVTDEIYEHLVYPPAEFASLAAVDSVRQRCVVVSGVAKTYAMTGWRVGWVVAPPEVAGAAATMQSHLSSNVNNIAQRAALAALEGPWGPVEEMQTVFDSRRRTMVEMLIAIPGVELEPPEGAFYCFPRVEGLLGREVRGRAAATTIELADIVLDEADVAFVPGEAFGAPGFARFSFALSADDLVEGLARLSRLFSEA